MAAEQSYFGNHGHHWPTAAYPFAYAMACIEVVLKNSDEAKAVFQKIVDAWQNPVMIKACSQLVNEIPGADTLNQKVQDAIVRPETVFLPDPNQVFKPFENINAEIEAIIENLPDDETNTQLTPDEEEGFTQIFNTIMLVFEFITVGFNRKSDIETGNLKVFMNGNAPWLMWGVMFRSSFDSYNITLEKLHQFYQVRKDEDKNKILDFEIIMTEQRNSAWYRKVVDSCQAVNLKLKND